MSHVGTKSLHTLACQDFLLLTFTPASPLQAPTHLGAYSERDILRLLGHGLSNLFDVFYNLPWSGMQGEQQSFGEYDFLIVSPGGQLLILEIKAGDVTENDDGLTKQYGRQGPKDIGHQMRRMHSSLLQRIDNGDLPQVHVGAMLVLPDHKTNGTIVSYPPERMVDASQIDQLCQRISSSFPLHTLPEDQRQRVLDFLANRFEVLPDVATHIGQVQQATTQLASGLATWVPRITHAEQLYQIEATAGSGKTQLALALLAQSAAQGRKARYVCFNRPLADHLARMAPTRCEVTTFDQPDRLHLEFQRVLGPSFLLLISFSPLHEFNHQLWSTFFGGKVRPPSTSRTASCLNSSA